MIAPKDKQPDKIALGGDSEISTVKNAKIFEFKFAIFELCGNLKPCRRKSCCSPGDSCKKN